MPPVTLSVLAVVLRMQGTDVEVYSDNQGVDQLLAQVREQLMDQVSPRESAGAKMAFYEKLILPRRYVKEYWKFTSQPSRPAPQPNPTNPHAPSSRHK